MFKVGKTTANVHNMTIKSFHRINYNIHISKMLYLCLNFDFDYNNHLTSMYEEIAALQKYYKSN